LRACNINHQILQRVSGFKALPTGHWKASANSSILDTTPLTLIRAVAWQVELAQVCCRVFK